MKVNAVKYSWTCSDLKILLLRLNKRSFHETITGKISTSIRVRKIKTANKLTKQIKQNMHIKNQNPIWQRYSFISNWININNISTLVLLRLHLTLKLHIRYWWCPPDLSSVLPETCLRFSWQQSRLKTRLTSLLSVYYLTFNRHTIHDRYHNHSQHPFNHR